MVAVSLKNIRDFRGPPLGPSFEEDVSFSSFVDRVANLSSRASSSYVLSFGAQGLHQAANSRARTLARMRDVE